MKRILTALVVAGAGLAIPAAAQAQDANGRSGWGCFAGAHFAERWANNKFTRIRTVNVPGYPSSGPAAPAAFGAQSPDAAGYGAQLGCDWHSGPWVFGAQIQHDNGVATTTAVTAFPTNSIRASAISLETITGRAGYMVAPDLLAYVRTGFAVVFNNYSVGTPAQIVGNTPVESASTRNLGFVLGGGLEWSINSDWSLYGEFQHNNFGSVPTVFNLTAAQTAGADVLRIRQSINQLLIGVNYHF